MFCSNQIDDEDFFLPISKSDETDPNSCYFSSFINSYENSQYQYNLPMNISSPIPLDNTEISLETPSEMPTENAHKKLHMNFQSYEDEVSFTLPDQMIKDLAALKIALRCDWKKIATKINKKYGLNLTQFALKTAFYSVVGRKKNKMFYTPEEDQLLLNAALAEGMNWEVISAKFFGGECPISLKNRHYKITSKERRYNKSVKAKIEKKKQMKISKDDFDLSTLVSDIKLKESPEWLMNFEKIVDEFKMF